SSTIHCTNSEVSARRIQLKPGCIGSASTSTSTSSSASSTRPSNASDWHSSGKKKSSDAAVVFTRFSLVVRLPGSFLGHPGNSKPAAAPDHRKNTDLPASSPFASARRRARQRHHPCYHRRLSSAFGFSASAYMSTDKTNQSWGGRFSEPVDAFVARFTASVEFDKRLYRHDIMGSIAHA